MNTRNRLPLAALVTLIALASALSLAPPTHAWVSPATGTPAPGAVLRPFDPPARDWLPGHRGVDLHAPPGTPIRAAGRGTVAFAGAVAGSPTVSLEHGEGILTTYQPVLPRVSAGDAVEEGQIIGVLAEAPASHHGPGTGLHWGARPLPDKDRYLNPLLLLPAPAIRLKPVDAPARRPSAGGWR
ncbi:M23 family metallopeptidase [Corynebacterium mastitidis]|uniref:M23 family peptidase n=1 Tax=Corynebacterium mastitidis TaxID=161890 RepID=A0A2N0X6N6_9CORY|nr:M23 family metallopeptidase [Corynebacterium mastitidis]MCH6196675.1 M23 family metallopeptidase [Corynebacterium mastitidis]PKF68347.1 M23 family peptidase [Corynebacterium mastitidis]